MKSALQLAFVLGLTIAFLALLVWLLFADAFQHYSPSGPFGPPARP